MVLTQLAREVYVMFVMMVHNLVLIDNLVLRVAEGKLEQVAYARTVMMVHNLVLIDNLALRVVMDTPV